MLDGAVLCEHLQQNLSALKRVEEALTEEYEALGQHQASLLESATRKKTEALHQYSHTQAALQTLVASSENLSTLIAGLPTHQQENDALRQQLDETATHCQTLNQRNGLTISGLQTRTRDALDILRHNSLGPGLYANDGQTTRSGDSRSLGKA